MKILIEKHEEGFFVQYNEGEFERQHLADVLATIIEPDYRNEIADLVTAMFEHWGVQRLTLEEVEGLWKAVAELAFEYVTVEGNHPIAALLALVSPLLLCKVAQLCPQLAQ